MLDKNRWLINSPIAHRGLWGGDIIENSIPAYQNAIDKGYPIEIDLYSSSNGVLYSFHDLSLARMCGVNKNITELSSTKIENLRLLSSNYKIPTFKEVLELVNGKVPLLIEIKNQPDKLIVERVLASLVGYKGEYAIQSFNPLYIKRVKKLAPKVTRGILATKVKEHLIGNSPLVRYIIRHTALNFIIKPHFISHDYSALPLNKRQRKNLPVIAWTVTNQNIYNDIKNSCDNIIFEHFIPEK